MGAEPQTRRPGGRDRGRRFDLALGILLGIVLGIAVVSAFVFLGEAGSIDSSHIEGVDTGKQAPAAREAKSGPEPGR